MPMLYSVGQRQALQTSVWRVSSCMFSITLRFSSFEIGCQRSAISLVRIFGATAAFRSMQARRRSGTQEVTCQRSGFHDILRITHVVTPTCRCGSGSPDPSRATWNSRVGLPPPWSTGRTFKPSCDGRHPIDPCSSTLLPSRASKSQSCSFSSVQFAVQITSWELSNLFPSIHQ